MRIITGSARGRRLKTPDNLDIRPTSDRVKEGMFSAIQFDIQGSSVLDLFAGSGQLGLEAASRGASSVCFVDKLPEALKIMRENIALSGLEDICEVFASDSISFLQSTGRKFDIVLIDPPYKSGLIEEAGALLPARLNKNGIVVCEHDAFFDMPESFGALVMKKQYKYGKTKLSLFRMDDEL